MGILLAIIASLLAKILEPIGIIWECVTLRAFSPISTYFTDVAISIDETGNVTCRSMFNDLLRKKDGYKFGVITETISSVLGTLQFYGKLTFLGKCVAGILDRIQADHCRISINPIFFLKYQH